MITVPVWVGGGASVSISYNKLLTYQKYLIIFKAMKKNITKTYTVYITKMALDFLEEHRDLIGDTRCMDMAVFFVHILERQLYNETQDTLLTSGETCVAVKKKHWHAHLMSRILVNFFGNSYIHLIRNLEKIGLIGRSDVYISSSFAKIAKVSPQSKAFYFKKDFAKYLSRFYNTMFKRKCVNEQTPVLGSLKKYVITDKVFIKRLERICADGKKYSKQDPIVDYCYDMLNHFSIDENVLENVCDTLKKEGYSDAKINGEREKAAIFNNMNEDPFGIYVKHDRYGRVHTNITNMKREIRLNALKCDGQDVGEVDIKSSQPAFLCLLLHRYLRKLSFDDIELPQTFIKYTPFYPAASGKKIIDKFNTELDRYTEEVFNKHIYEFFQERMVSVDGKPVTRTIAKKALISFMFSPVYFNEKKEAYRAQVRDIWLKEFPILAAAIRHLKTPNHAALAYELQKIESSFVFDNLIPKLNERIGCPILTVHDSVILPKQYLNQAKSIADELLMEFDIPTATEIELGTIYQEMCPDSYVEVAVYNQMEAAGELGNGEIAAA